MSNNQLPRYRCHKVVEAVKIKSVEPSGCAASFIVPTDENIRAIEVSSEYVRKHEPQPGGYYVRYLDGYESFSPAKAFEEGYSPIAATTDAQTPMPNTSLAHRAAGNLGFCLSVIRSGETLSPAEEANVQRVIKELQKAAREV